MQLRLDRLAPWDLAVDALGREPLRPFASAGELVEGADAIFASVAPVFSQEFGILREKGLLDLDSRRGKAPGGYQSSLDETRLPFIFMNAAGRNRDVFTLLHEGGHAFHALAARQEPVLANRSAPIEFCEVASMGMEMMGCERLAAFYDPESAQRAREMHLEDTVVLLPWIARVDAFQHWVYMHPGHTRRERADAWLDLDRRFGDDLDWADLPEWRECSWIAKLHLFCVPLYYIEYGIAQIGALQLWRRFLDDPGEAVDCYRLGLSLGNTRTLPELFEATGIRFVFDSGTMRPLIDCIAGVLGVEEK
jgi:oligoendopeptidase F